MSLIKELPEHIANQIAAGEVIQRPASVVKELLENSIDSGATEIFIHIKDSGKTLIHVLDNGTGMNSIDSKNCFKRHATSKISDVNDLYKLKTKGFRGEALASIAAISHVSLKTKTSDNDSVGVETIIEGGELISQKECICNKGTSIEIKNLFFNVPVRRNFLKSDSVEFNHIRNEFEHIALSHFNIKLVLVHNNQELFHLNASNLKKRIVDVFGSQINESLIPIEEQTNIIRISGFISKPDKVKKTRGEQYLFVNQRFFKDNYFNHAIIKAFEKLIPEKTYPTYFIYFEINPNKIDVNIHPTKTEIKFEEDRFIYSILNSSIRRALGKHNVFPSLDFENNHSFDLPVEFKKNEPREPKISVNPNYNPFKENNERSNPNSSALNRAGFDQYKKDWENLYSFQSDKIAEQSSFNLDLEHNLIKEDSLIIRDKYIIFSTDGGISIVDTKRALQRIIFNQILEKFQLQPIACQQLLFPEKIDLNQEEISLLENNMTLLSRLGFEGSLTKHSIELKGIPNVLSIDLFPQIFQEIIETLKYRELDNEDIAYRLISKISTIASISSKIKTKLEAVELLEQLFKCEEYSTTSGGKKIIQELTIKEISSKF